MAHLAFLFELGMDISDKSLNRPPRIEEHPFNVITDHRLTQKNIGNGLRNFRLYPLYMALEAHEEEDQPNDNPMGGGSCFFC